MENGLLVKVVVAISAAIMEAEKISYAPNVESMKQNHFPPTITRPKHGFVKAVINCIRREEVQKTVAQTPILSVKCAIKIMDTSVLHNAMPSNVVVSTIGDMRLKPMMKVFGPPVMNADSQVVRIPCRNLNGKQNHLKT